MPPLKKGALQITSPEYTFQNLLLQSQIRQLEFEKFALVGCFSYIMRRLPSAIS